MTSIEPGQNDLEAIAQIGVGVAGIVGITVAIMRTLRAGREYHDVINTLREERDYWQAEALRGRAKDDDSS